MRTCNLQSQGNRNLLGQQQSCFSMMDGHHQRLLSCRLLYSITKLKIIMKSIDWLALTRIKMSRVLSIAAVVVFAFACSDGSEDVTPSADASARKNGLNANDNPMLIAKVKRRITPLWLKSLGMVLPKRFAVLEVHNNISARR